MNQIFKLAFFIIVVTTLSLLPLALRWIKTAYPPHGRQILECSLKSYNLSINYIGRLGNILFQYAGHLALARQNEMNVVLPSKSSWVGFFPAHHLRNFFQVPKWPLISPQTIATTYTGIKEAHPIGYLDTRLLCLGKEVSQTANIVLTGFLQSWKYFEPIKDEIRQQFQPSVFTQNKIRKFLDTVKVSFPDHITVGIHIRKGDFKASGYATAAPHYLNLSITYMQKRFGKVVFIAASDDMPWVKRTLRPHSNVVYSERNFYAAEDLHLLSSCHHVIISSGTFSWWAGWLSNGTVIYMDSYPKLNSSQSKFFDAKSYYPEQWIPFSAIADHI